MTGANRGIGLGLVSAMAARPDSMVFAGTRTPEKAKDLIELARTHPNVQIIPHTAGDGEGNIAAAKIIKGKAGHLDVVFANAGEHILSGVVRISLC